MPQQDPWEPLKVTLGQTQFWDSSTRIKAIEGDKANPAEKHKWEVVPIEEVQADKHFLQGGARGFADYNETLQCTNVCDRCHATYAQPSAIAFYTDPSLKMTLGKIEIFNLHRQADAQVRHGDMEKAELIATAVCYAACFRCAGEVLHNSMNHYAGKE